MTDLVRGASRESLGSARQRLAAQLSGQPDAARQVGEELFGVVDLLDGQPALRAALTDPGRDHEARTGLISGLLRNKVAAATLEPAVAAVRERWSAPQDLAEALSDLGVQALAVSAEQRDALDDVEDDVFRFGQIVSGTPQLRAALTDRAAPAPARAGLLERLLQGKAQPETLALLRRAVLAPRGRSLEDALQLVQRQVAERRRRRTATVVSALPLSGQQRTRLAVALQRQAGMPVHLNVIVDPDVVGGFKVSLGDEVIDATLANRLRDARRKMAGEAMTRRTGV